jgi:hypothetical protein
LTITLGIKRCCEYDDGHDQWSYPQKYGTNAPQFAGGTVRGRHGSLGLSLRDKNHKSFGLFLAKARCKLLSHLAIQAQPHLAPARDSDLGHLV